MTAKQLAENAMLEVVCMGNENAEISGVYCCDLLSIVMSKAFEGCAWITVMGNVNAVAVASLVDMGVIILAENADADPVAVKKAEENGINIFKGNGKIFEIATKVNEAINNA